MDLLRREICRRVITEALKIIFFPIGKRGTANVWPAMGLILLLQEPLQLLKSWLYLILDQLFSLDFESRLSFLRDHLGKVEEWLEEWCLLWVSLQLLKLALHSCLPIT